MDDSSRDERARSESDQRGEKVASIKSQVGEKRRRDQKSVVVSCAASWIRYGISNGRGRDGKGEVRYPSMDSGKGETTRIVLSSPGDKLDKQLKRKTGTECVGVCAS